MGSEEGLERRVGPTWKRNPRVPGTEKASGRWACSLLEFVESTFCIAEESTLQSGGQDRGPLHLDLKVMPCSHFGHTHTHTLLKRELAKVPLPHPEGIRVVLEPYNAPKMDKPCLLLIPSTPWLKPKEVRYLT
uniref:Uncharacterized protein n=1 Tax=Pipistrellus kuhlii TaxID=59472 RepID=A0A7J7YML6_PIPKU|nr:hypothetical protein mPipKuh1_010112 [Pipistrellus kuhlii]